MSYNLKTLRFKSVGEDETKFKKNRKTHEDIYFRNLHFSLNIIFMHNIHWFGCETNEYEVHRTCSTHAEKAEMSPKFQY